LDDPLARLFARTMGSNCLWGPLYRARPNGGLSGSIHNKPGPIVGGPRLICVGEEQRVAAIRWVGDNVNEMLQGFPVALKMGATKADPEDAIVIYPIGAG
jgi:hypothetical protein